MLNKTVSKFNNYKDTNPKDVNLLGFLQDDRYKYEVIKIRSLTDKDQIRDLKSKLPTITPSGIFASRNASGLIQHSGIICIDIDAGDNPQISSFADLRDELKKINNVLYASLSVSGKGVFCLIQIKHVEKHKEHFEALKIVFKKLGIVIDKACGDVSRLRGYSWDENAFHNLNAVPFEIYYDHREFLEKRMIDHYPNGKLLHQDSNATKQKVLRIILTALSSGIDLTAEYSDWFKIACALANEFGDEGREYFHLVSSNYLKYHYEKCDNFFSICQQKQYPYTIGTFFHIAEQLGLK